MTMRAWAFVGTGVVAVAALAFAVTRDTRPPAERAAHAACEHVAAFTRIVEENGPAPRATAELARAERKAHEAATIDIRFLPLEGGVQALRLAIAEDDADAADEGLAVTRAHCERVS